MDFKTITKVPLSFFHDPEDKWENTYNNQGFFKHNVERLRWNLVEMTWLDNNPFAGCVDLKTLTVKDPIAFYRLAMSYHQELLELVEKNDWDWSGDDFDHMEGYLEWIHEQDPTFCYSSQVINGDEFLHIRTWKMPSEFDNDDLRKAYIQGVRDTKEVFYDY